MYVVLVTDRKELIVISQTLQCIYTRVKWEHHTDSFRTTYSKPTRRLGDVLKLIERHILYRSKSLKKAKRFAETYHLIHTC